MTKVGRFGVVVLLLGLLPACSGGGLAEPEASTVLRILEGTVEHATGDVFSPAADGANLGPGDTIRTGADGRAAIQWFDGSITRLDHGTTLTISAFGLDGGDTVVEATQESGSTYHVVGELTGTGSRFDVETPTATAAVQGTEFALFVDPDGGTVVAVIDASVVIEALGGSVTVGAGLSLEIPPSAASLADLGDPQPIPQDLLEGEWLTFNEPPPAPFFEAAIDLDHIGINYYPVGAEVTVRIYDEEGGELLDEGSVIVTSPDGTRFDSFVDIEAGQYVEVTQGSSVRETVVVPLTFDVFDRDAGLLEGTADPGTVVVAFVEVAPSGLVERIETVADADGHWSITVVDLQILPHHTSSVRIEDSDGDTTLAHAPDVGA